MTEEYKIAIIKAKLKKYHNSFRSLETEKEDLLRYKEELLRNITDLNIYEKKRNQINENIIGGSLVSMICVLGLGLISEKFNAGNEIINALISNPRIYAAIALALSGPLAFSHKIADAVIQNKYGREIEKKKLINNENEGKIELIDQNLNVIDSDISYTFDEIRKLKDVLEVLDEVENESFLKIRQPRIKQLVD